MTSPTTDPAAARRFAVRLALFYGALFVCFGTHLPFFPVWLSAVGLDASWIGLVTATPMLARLVAVPLATRLADRHHMVRRVLRALAVASVAGLALTGIAPGPIALVAAYVVTASVWTPVLPLADAYALRGVARHPINYGPIRLWGSAAFVAGALIAGYLGEVVGAPHLIWIVVGTALLGALVGFALDPVDDAAGTAPAAAPAMRLLRMPAFWIVVASAGLVQGSHAAYYNFSSIMWRGEGMSGGMIAVLWSLGVVAEIVVFALSPRVALTPRGWLAIGAAGAALRWAAMCFQPTAGWLWMIQPLHALSFGATHLGTMGLMARLVPAGLTATAQGVLAVATGGAMALASVTAGALYQPDGRAMFAVMLVMAAGGLALASVVARQAPDEA